MSTTFEARALAALRWLLVVGIAYSLATSVLFFLGGPASGSGVSTGLQPRAASAPRAVKIDEILARNLFGVVSDAAIAPAASEVAVATRLPLELRGVFVAEPESASAAIVAVKGRPGERYTVGATLPGDAELVEVLSDHIVLHVAGMREVLNFPAYPVGGSVSSVVGDMRIQDLQPDAFVDAAPIDPVPEPGDFGGDFGEPMEAIDAAVADVDTEAVEAPNNDAPAESDEPVSLVTGLPISNRDE